MGLLQKNPMEGGRILENIWNILPIDSSGCLPLWVIKMGA